MTIKDNKKSNLLVRENNERIEHERRYFEKEYKGKLVELVSPLYATTEYTQEMIPAGSRIIIYCVKAGVGKVHTFVRFLHGATQYRKLISSSGISGRGLFKKVME